jgi:hypothetical protein
VQKQELPSDSQAKQTFAEHRAEFENLKTKLLAEKSLGFTVEYKVQDIYRVKPRTERVSSSTIEACKELMKQINADKVIRSNRAVCVRIGLVENKEKYQEKSIVFDPSGVYMPPVVEPKLSRQFIDLGSGWNIVNDKIDLAI